MTKSLGGGGGEKKMEFRKTMMARRILVVVVAMIAFASVVSAGVIVSNVLSGTTYVHQAKPLEVYWYQPNTGLPNNNIPSLYVDGSSIATDIWGGMTYAIAVQLFDPNNNPPNGPSVKVVVKFEIHGLSVSDLQAGDVAINYWDGASWLPLPINFAGAGYAYGNFGPPAGFTVGPTYNQVTDLQVAFGVDVTEQNYQTTIWCTTL
jgi:hypothetical protein